MAEIFVPTPSSPPPTTASRWFLWAKKNLFGSPISIVLSTTFLYLIWLYLPPAMNWALLDANFAGTDRSSCEANPDGACWTAIRVRFWQVMLGLYYGSHTSEIWRPILTFTSLVILVSTLLIPRIPVRSKTYVAAFTVLVFPFIGFAVIHGGWIGLEIAPTSQWGGFMLTFILAAVGITMSLPIGIALALGRRSKMPVIRWCSIAFIEFWRANPLITILFMASNLLPLFFPAEVEFDKVARALIAITLFQSAYTAEAVRGGLSAVHRGQFEAADALGMGYVQKTVFIVLPQALKTSIPGIVNAFIELFKDTTLVSIIGLLDLFSMSQTVSRSTEWKGYDYETYIFSALIFFICCYGMSRYSRSIEHKLDTGHKK